MFFAKFQKSNCEKNITTLNNKSTITAKMYILYLTFFFLYATCSHFSSAQIIGGCNPVDLCFPEVVQISSCAVERYLSYIDHACYEYNINSFCEQVVNGLIYKFDVDIRPNFKTGRCASYFQSWTSCETISFTMYRSPIYNGMMPRCDGSNDIMCGNTCLTITDSTKVADCSNK